MSFANEIFEILRNAVNETKYRTAIQECPQESAVLKDFGKRFTLLQNKENVMYNVSNF
jgi:hypothetical protein